MTNYNPLFNGIGNQLGIEAGSWDWLRGGPAPNSGSAGEQSSYGWRRDHMLATHGPDYVRWVLANYLHRPIYYNDEPRRIYGSPGAAGYQKAGRPLNWRPEEPNELSNGAQAYFNTSQAKVIEVSGPDVQHAWFTPLWATLDSPAVTLSVYGNSWSSHDLAIVTARMHMRSLMGQIRADESGTPYPWGYADRGNVRIIDAMLQALKHRCIEEPELHTGQQFLLNVALPEYEKPPGIINFGGSTPWFRIGCFNSLFWLIPVFYDAWQFMKGTVTGERCEDLVRRWCQWAVDLNEVTKGWGFDATWFEVDEAQISAGQQAKGPTWSGLYVEPLPSIKDLIDPNRVHFDPKLTWDHWAYRACAITAGLTGDPGVIAVEKRIRSRYAGVESKKQWMVGADREYV